MDASPLQRLAPELRNRIWELALTQADPVKVHGKNGRNVAEPGALAITTTDSHPLALRQTCRQISSECGRLFYIHNSFTFPATFFDHLAGSKTPVCQPLSALAAIIGAENAAVIRAVKVLCREVRMDDPVDTAYAFTPESALRCLWELHDYAAGREHWHLGAIVEFWVPVQRLRKTVKCVVELKELTDMKRSLTDAATKLEMVGAGSKLQPHGFDIAASTLRMWASGIEDEEIERSDDRMYD
ncbi:hypothetical protein LTR36_010989 [Oleoguttula mirabilis]|uniref:2EXR domain-containing protein n=1 Tax=Oleoguttula mirabilis TaxID=1507867 RepID=A0AAV9J3E5_9PEZI|nr:hypothetical protein LTR36_010989 [Oleoguttula mirabilis]